MNKTLCFNSPPWTVGRESRKTVDHRKKETSLLAQRVCLSSVLAATHPSLPSLRVLYTNQMHLHGTQVKICHLSLAPALPPCCLLQELIFTSCTRIVERTFKVLSFVGYFSMQVTYNVTCISIWSSSQHSHSIHFFFSNMAHDHVSLWVVK